MTVSRVATWIVAFLVGVVYGVAGTVGQAASLGGFPLGVCVAIIGVAAVLTAVRLLTADRWSAFAAAMGAMLATLLFSGAGPGGSVIVPAPAEGEMITTGIIWTLAVPIVAALVIAWPAARQSPRTR